MLSANRITFTLPEKGTLEKNPCTWWVNIFVIDGANSYFTSEMYPFGWPLYKKEHPKRIPQEQDNGLKLDIQVPSTWIVCH